MKQPTLWVVENFYEGNWEPCEDDPARDTEEAALREMAEYKHLHPNEKYRVAEYVRADR